MTYLASTFELRRSCFLIFMIWAWLNLFFSILAGMSTEDIPSFTSLVWSSSNNFEMSVVDLDLWRSFSLIFSSSLQLDSWIVLMSLLFWYKSSLIMSPSGLKWMDPVELTPLELCMLRMESVLCTLFFSVFCLSSSSLVPQFQESLLCILVSLSSCLLNSWMASAVRYLLVSDLEDLLWFSFCLNPSSRMSGSEELLVAEEPFEEDCTCPLSSSPSSWVTESSKLGTDCEDCTWWWLFWMSSERVLSLESCKRWFWIVCSEFDLWKKWGGHLLMGLGMGLLLLLKSSDTS